MSKTPDLMMREAKDIATQLGVEVDGWMIACEDDEYSAFLYVYNNKGECVSIFDEVDAYESQEAAARWALEKSLRLAPAGDSPLN